MITCVTWLPSKCCKEWPDKLHEIPIKHLPIQIDNFMHLEESIVEQFMNEDDNDDDNDDNKEIDNNNNNQKNKLKSKNSRKRKFSEIEKISDN